MAAPVATKFTAIRRLSFAALMADASFAPNHAPVAWAGAMQTQIARSTLPIAVAFNDSEARVATIVAGTPTTMPAAAARPMLLWIGMPETVMTIFVRIPPPIPANPEDRK